MAINPTALANVNGTLLPPTITGPIFNKAAEQSAVMSLARRVPLSINAQTAIPVPMDIPVADWVGEGGAKTGGQAGVGVKTMTGKKIALLVPVSDEVASTNPGGLYDQLEQDLPTAISRAFDFAAINGKSLKTGGAGPFSDYLALTSSTVALGTGAQSNGGLYNDIVTGAGKVVDKNYDFTGIAADPRFKIDAQLQTDTQGHPLFNDEAGTLAGFQTFFNKGVSGKYWRAGDSVQTITIAGTPTGGTFIVSSGGNSYTAAYNVSAATLQSAIQAWGGVYATVTVTGTAGSSYVITFPAVSTNIASAAAPVTVNGKALTGGTNVTATVAASGAGGTDSLLRGIGGDWSQAAYGVGMDITIKVSQEASYYDGSTWHSAFQENLTLLLVEAYFGFVMGSPDAFVAYTKGTAAF
ncbi:ABC transporter substrate binding protein [Leifsonia xyli subsp. cynodontis DSM 46306]|uniref:Phage capsid-like C-terminal domain-containing protein n=1 Tax=Leifsonia xyli subsp. cynodontis DSM 46306 TaxID=1389489 RepID=U3PF35_LEIXC|nr:phage major capsid protein [Leifsonia xyli]AGW41735.1 ABC transporter substrate binding protein [Leifsonia xyli subsp. cynodontis DSM 46306]AGW42258.1 ABC transporter substrate binding protein [Leifsonia xyli subsp. cynodontis DSM 46306]